MPKPKKLTTNGVVQLYSRMSKPPKLTVQKLDKNSVLIEGNAKALEFLGEYLLAHSRADLDDCHVGLSPKGAGSAWFTKESTLGFYFYRLPCRDRGPMARRKRKLAPRSKVLL